MPTTKTCKLCGQPFQARNRRASYCDGPCFREMERRYSARARASWSPERRRAYVLVQSAIYRGTLVRQPCEVCGKRGGTYGIHAHHDDYTKPLEVRWLCLSHHKRHHDALRKAGIVVPGA